MRRLHRRWGAVLALSLGMLGAPAMAGEKEEADLVKANAAAWLLLFDAGDYGRSWDEASSFWQHDHTRERTAEMLAQLRSPLGRLRERNFNSFELLQSPDGEVAQLTFRSSYDEDADVLEIMELMREASGEWKVSLWAFRHERR